MKDPFKLNVKSIMALYELFPTEEACIKHLEAINWHDKPVSPFDKTSRVYKLNTDEYNAYDQIGFSYTRFYVDHSKKLYSYDHITTNRIEGTWTHFKRMVKGTYRTLLKKYLQKYVDEFVYRYNLRDISNSDRFNCFLCCADTRYTYKQIKESVCLK